MDYGNLIGHYSIWGLKGSREEYETMHLAECVTAFSPLWDSLKSMVPSSTLILCTYQYQWIKVLRITAMFKLFLIGLLEFFLVSLFRGLRS